MNRYSIPRGERGSEVTLGIMLGLAHAGGTDSARVVTTALRVPRLIDLFDFGRRFVTYRPDPPGVEFLRFPGAMIHEIGQAGTVGADCDELSTLLLALMTATGRRGTFAVVRDGPNKPWQHVLAVALTEMGHFPIDPQEAESPGKWPKKSAEAAVFDLDTLELRPITLP